MLLACILIEKHIYLHSDKTENSVRRLASGKASPAKLGPPRAVCTFFGNMVANRCKQITSIYFVFLFRAITPHLNPFALLFLSLCTFFYLYLFKLFRPYFCFYQVTYLASAHASHFHFSATSYSLF